MHSLIFSSTTFQLKVYMISKSNIYICIASYVSYVKMKYLHIEKISLKIMYRI